MCLFWLSEIVVAVALSNFNCINFAKIPETEKIGTFELFW